MAVGQGIAEKIDRVLDIASEGLTDEKREIMYKGLTIINNNLNMLCDSFGGEQ